MVVTRRHVYFIGLSLWSILCYWLFILYNNSVDYPFDRFANITDVIGWEHGRGRNASDYIFPDRITTLVNSYRTCAAAYPPLVLALVSSSTDHFALRAAIRRTWAHSIEEKFNISVVFLVGVSGNENVDGRLKDESNELGDIIVEDFVDTYNNLTLKSLMMLKWVKNNCQNAPYMLRLDDDVYINVKNLATFVGDIARTDSRGILCGDLYCSGIAIRDPFCKWYIPPYMYAEEFYPDFLAGYCYLTSMEIALQLYEEAFRIPMIHIDDVFLTGICANRIGITPSEHYSFKGFRGGKASMNECTVEDEYLIAHSFDISAEKMYAVHAFISNCSSSNNDETSFSRRTKFVDEFVYCATKV